MSWVVLFDSTSIKTEVAKTEETIKETAWREGIKYKKKASEGSKDNLHNILSKVDVRDPDEKSIENEIFKARICTLLEE